MRATKWLAAIGAADLVGVVATLRWRGAFWVLSDEAVAVEVLALGMSAALVGLISAFVVLAPLRRVRRVAIGLVGAALLDLYWAIFSDWNDHDIGQLRGLFAVQACSLIAAMVVARSVQGDRHAGRRSAWRLQASILDLVGLIGAIAPVCATLRATPPHLADLGEPVLVIASGASMALVAGAVLWSCFGSAPLGLRLAGIVLVAPTGVLVHTLFGPENSLHSWRSFASLTLLQVVFMLVPCLALRARGFRFGPRPAWAGPDGGVVRVAARGG